MAFVFNESVVLPASDILIFRFLWPVKKPFQSDSIRPYALHNQWSIQP